MTTKSVVEAYLDGWKRKDVTVVERLLSKSVSSKGPMLSTEGRESFIAAVNAVLPLVNDVALRHLIVDGDKAVAVYDFICVELIGVCRVAELICVKNELIHSSEIFFDARPFEEAMA